MCGGILQGLLVIGIVIGKSSQLSHLETPSSNMRQISGRRACSRLNEPVQSQSHLLPRRRKLSRCLDKSFYSMAQSDDIPRDDVSQTLNFIGHLLAFDYFNF